MDITKKLSLPSEFRVPYGRQLLTYTLDIASKITGKALPDTHIWHAHSMTAESTVSPQDCLNVLGDIKAILKENGPLLPWKVERKLVERHAASIPDHLLDTAGNFAALDHQPEPMTGWNQKAFGGLIVAQAALHKETTENPAAIFDADLSNMRGTNELYYWLLCMESDHEWEGPDGARDPELMAQAQALTDRATRILAAIAIQKTGGEGIRNGGDELRIVVPGFPEDRKKAEETVSAIHDASEIATARMGLHDHPHAKPKHASDPNRNGFGNAVGWFWLPTDDVNFVQGAKQAEAETDNAKIDLGRARRTGKYEEYKIEAYQALSGRLFVMPQTEEEKKDLAGRAADYLKASQAAMAALEDELGIGPPPMPENMPSPNLHRLGQLAGNQDFDHIPRDSELRDLIAETFRNSLTSQDKAAFEALSEEDRHLVEMMAAHAPMRDYVSGAYAGQDLPALSDIVFQVNDSLHRRAQGDMSTENPGFFAISTSINISGVNKHLGHEPTNTILEHFNTKILTDALAAADLAPENACIVSLGGGDFTILLQNIVQRPDGNWRVIKENDVRKITDNIAQGTQALNDSPSSSFLKESEYSHIGKIPDARQENVTGIRLFSTYQELSVPPDRHDPGGLIAGRILQHFKQEKEKTPAPTPTLASIVKPAEPAPGQP